MKWIETITHSFKLQIGRLINANQFDLWWSARLIHVKYCTFSIRSPQFDSARKKTTSFSYVPFASRKREMKQSKTKHHIANERLLKVTRVYRIPIHYLKSSSENTECTLFWRKDSRAHHSQANMQMVGHTEKLGQMNEINFWDFSICCFFPSYRYSVITTHRPDLYFVCSFSLKFIYLFVWVAVFFVLLWWLAVLMR